MKLRRKIIILLILIPALMAGLFGCNFVDNKPVDAYQLVYEVDFSSIAEILEDEDAKEEILDELKNNIEKIADEYTDMNNVYFEEGDGKYFGIIEVPQSEVDSEKMKLENTETKALEFAIQDDETNKWIKTELDDSYLASAEVQFDDFYQPYVLLDFNNEGAKLFEEITEQNIGKKLAIFVKGELITSPIVNEKISGGSALITGQFTNKEAESLAQELNSSIYRNIRLIEINKVKSYF